MYWKVCPFLAKSMVHDDGASYGNVDTPRMAKMTTFMYNEQNWSQWLPLWRLIRFFYWHYSNNWVYLNKHIPQIDEGDIHKVACSPAPAAAFSNLSLFNRGTHISSMENWMSLLKGACECLTPYIFFRVINLTGRKVIRHFSNFSLNIFWSYSFIWSKTLSIELSINYT